jgi:hypothetical protein
MLRRRQVYKQINLPFTSFLTSHTPLCSAAVLFDPLHSWNNCDDTIKKLEYFQDMRARISIY